MKLQQLAEIEQDAEWANGPSPVSSVSIRKKMKSLEHQADIMMSKLQTWAKIAKGKVFTVTGVKSGMQLPKQVAADPRKFITWNLTHSNPNVVTKVFADKSDPKIVLPIRALINRHNELVNSMATMQGLLAKLNANKTSSVGPK